MRVEVLRVDGTRETHDVADMQAVMALIGCDVLDFVTLSRDRHGVVTLMAVDDAGYDTELVTHGDQPDPRRPGQTVFVVENRCVRARKPVNVEATRLYHLKCGGDNGHQIVGDVALMSETSDGD